jgi:hypothetical protein
MKDLCVLLFFFLPTTCLGLPDSGGSDHRQKCAHGNQRQNRHAGLHPVRRTLGINISIRPFHKIAKMEPGCERHGGYLGFT